MSLPPPRSPLPRSVPPAGDVDRARPGIAGDRRGAPPAARTVPFTVSVDVRVHGNRRGGQRLAVHLQRAGADGGAAAAECCSSCPASTRRAADAAVVAGSRSAGPIWRAAAPLRVPAKLKVSLRLNDSVEVAS